MNVTVRVATAEDMTAIQALNHELFMFEKQFGDSYNEWWMYEDKGIEYFLRRLTNLDGRNILLVADIDEEVVGYLAGYVDEYPYRSKNPIAEIENMFVFEERRRQGIGKKLVNIFEKIAHQLEAKRMRVGAYAQNTTAISFYKNNRLFEHETILEKELC